MTNVRWLSLLAWLVVLFSAPLASAHPVGLSRGEYRATERGLEIVFAFSESELRPLRGGATATPSDLGSAVLRRMSVRAGGARCSGRVLGADTKPPDGVELRLEFGCPNGAAVREVELAELFGLLTRGHRHEADVRGDAERATELLFEEKSRLALRAPAPNDAARNATSETSLAGLALGFVRMGVEHILTGFDHLVFLLGLVVVGLERRRVLAVVSAFTLAHSLTLAASVMGLWSPPSSLVEPLIALSVAYVGVENFVARSFDRRTLLAFAFGLIHGFGFAGALSEVRFEGAALSLGLVAFNVGVELGQLVVLAALLPLIAAVRHRPPLFRRVVPLVNAAVVLLGVAWFVERVA